MYKQDKSCCCEKRRLRAEVIDHYSRTKQASCIGACVRCYEWDGGRACGKGRIGIGACGKGGIGIGACGKGGIGMVPAARGRLGLVPAARGGLGLVPAARGDWDWCLRQRGELGLVPVQSSRDDHDVTERKARCIGACQMSWIMQGGPKGGS